MWISAEYAPYNVELRVKTRRDYQFTVVRLASMCRDRETGNDYPCDVRKISDGRGYLTHLDDVMSYWYAT